MSGLSRLASVRTPGRWPLLIDARMDVKDIYGAGELVGGQDRDEPLV